MDAQEAVERFDEWLWDDVRNVDYPSTPMLDRLERNLRGPEDAGDYVALLMEKAGDDFKSPTMMARAERMAQRLRMLQQLRERLQQEGSQR